MCNVKQVDMSFGFSASDVVLLVQLAWTTVRNSRKACGVHAELTRETTSLHVNLRRLEREIAKPDSPINRPSDNYRQDLAPIVDGCEKALDVLDRILEKYNTLSDEERSKGKLWKAVRFGNGELANVKDLRSKLTYYTSNLSLFLNMVSIGSMGVVEKQLYEAGGDLKDIRRAVNGITVHLMSSAIKEGSVLTDYAGDDKAVWRAFRRELIKGGFSSDVIRDHKDTIQAYVKELGSRGILDDEDLKDSGNVSEEIEDTAPPQATSKPRDEATDSFEHKTGAARDGLSPRSGTTGHLEDLSITVNRDAREDQTFQQQTQTAPIPLTTNNILDTLPSTTQADAEMDSVVESNSRDLEKVDDRASLAQKLAEEDTWFFGGKSFRNAFRYYTYDCDLAPLGISFYRTTKHAPFERLSDLPHPFQARGEILEFQTEESRPFQKVAEVRKPHGKKKPLLKMSPLFYRSKSVGRRFIRLIENGRPETIISDLLEHGLYEIDAREERWRITKWPSPREKSKREGLKNGGKGKCSTVPPHATPAVVGDTQDPSSTTKEAEMKDDNEFVRTKDKARTEEEKPTVTVMPEPEPETNISWGSFSKKEKKKSKRKSKKTDKLSINELIDLALDPNLDFK